MVTERLCVLLWHLVLDIEGFVPILASLLLRHISCLVSTFKRWVSCTDMIDVKSQESSEPDRPFRKSPCLMQTLAICMIQRGTRCGLCHTKHVMHLHWLMAICITRQHVLEQTCRPPAAPNKVLWHRMRPEVRAAPGRGTCRAEVVRMITARVDGVDDGKRASRRSCESLLRAAEIS